MKVLCIKKATRNTVTGKPIKSSTTEGRIYNAVGDDPTDKEYYIFSEFPYYETRLSFWKGNFIPVSEIDETEMVREYDIVTNH